LQLFEQVRRNRGSALQVLSSTNPPTPESVLDAAAKFLPNGKRLDTAEEVDEYVLSFDVIGESKAALAASL
jgi:salicylate hydroxylase